MTNYIAIEKLANMPAMKFLMINQHNCVLNLKLISVKMKFDGIVR